MEYKVALCDDDEKIASKIMEAFNNELQCVCSISSDTRIVFITSHEELVFDTVTTGAANDIEQATRIARAMVTQYGMSEKLGMINYGSDDDEVFIGRDLAHTRSYGERVASDIDSEVKRIIDECYAKAKQIILEHEDILHKCSALLIEKEKIGQAEFDRLFTGAEEKSAATE